MKRMSLYVIIGATLSFWSCSPVKLVSERKMMRPDPSKYETFAFGQLEKRVKVNHTNSKKTEVYLMEQIKEEMEQRGYVYVEENPDFYVDMELLLRNIKRQNDPYPSNYGGWGWGWRRRYYSPTDRYGYYNDIQQGSYSEAKINLLVGKPTEERRMYEGAVRTRLSPNPRKGSQRLDMAIDRLIASFLGG